MLRSLAIAFQTPRFEMSGNFISAQSAIINSDFIQLPFKSPEPIIPSAQEKLCRIGREREIKFARNSRLDVSIQINRDLIAIANHHDVMPRARLQNCAPD